MDNCHCKHGDDLERRLAQIEAAVAVLRWIIPILVTGTGVLVVLAR